MTGKIAFPIDGRLALPLRALSYMTAWATSPDAIVRALALEPTVRVGEIIQKMAGHRVEILNRHALCGNRMMADGSWEAIPPSQWQSVAVELSSLTAQMKADERPGADGENHARWRVAATMALPDDVFVWLDDFERWFADTRPLAVPTEDDMDLWRLEQAKLYADEDLAMILEEGMCEFSCPGAMDYVVIFPNELVDKTWRYGSAVLEPDKVRSPNNKARAGRPPSQDRKAAAVGIIMKLFAEVGALGPDPKNLPGGLADLLEACQRIEHARGETTMFSVTEDTFRVWLTKAGYGFRIGRSVKAEAGHWTGLAPHIAAKIPSEVFQ